MSKDQDATDGLPDPTAALSRGVRIAMQVLPAIAIGAWLVLAFAHLNDRYNVNAVSGSLLALADRARDGVLYPPLVDGQWYGGTRVMPLPILLYAFAISAGGELLAPAKLVDFVASVGLIVLVVGVLLRLRAGPTLSLALAASVMTSQVFLLPATGLRPESLPTALQLGALALVAFGSRGRGTLIAAVLCAVAIFCKLSAVWGPIAIVVWLAAHDRRRLGVFATALVAFSVALLGLFVVASEGRMLDNILGLGGAGLSLVGIVKSPLKAGELLLQYGQATVILAPVLLLGLMFAGRRSRPTIFQVALLAAAGVGLIVLSDAGSDYNHLLDVVVLAPIATWEVARTLDRRAEGSRLVMPFLASVLLVGTAGALAANVVSGVATTLGLPGSPGPSLDPQPLTAELAGADSLLAEDPYLPLERGQRPVVLDAFMLLRIGNRDPGAVQPLLTRVSDELFDALVVNEDLADPDSRSWFTTFAFGLPFYEAMRDHYRLCAASQGYFVYAPNSLPCPGG
jgi:hypothetical protein